MLSQDECDVLIVGGGPTGVTLALSLAQQGVSVIVAEKEAEIYPLPRAATIDHEVMRILQNLGVANDVVRTCRHSKRYDFLAADGQILLRYDGRDAIGAGGWILGNAIHQPSVEAILRNAYAKKPHCELRSNWAMTGFAETAVGVQAQFSTPNGAQSISCRYLVGADGARSPTRQILDVTFDDLDFDEPWLVIDVIVHDYSRLPDHNLQICDPARPTTCVLMGEGRHRWEFMIKPGETREEVLDDAFVEKLLSPWKVADCVTLERKAVYRFNARIAKHWRVGRVLLAGDAAHQTPPFAGQGMCAGMRDAANLGWKLAAVVNDVADDALLNTYQPERAPHVRATIDRAIMMGRTVCVTDPVEAAARDVRMLADRAAGKGPDRVVDYPPINAGYILEGAPGAGSYFPQFVAGALKLDDALGPGAWLIGRNVASDLGREPTRPVKSRALGDDSLMPFRDQIDAWLERHDAAAVLVRPDRYVFGAGEPQNLRQQFFDL